MELCYVRTEQDAFAPGEQQYNTVGQVGFHFQSDCPAIHKAVAVFKCRAVEQQLIAPIYRFVTCHCRAAQRKEKGF